MRPLITIAALLLGCPADPELDTSEIVGTDDGEAPTITVDSPIEIEPGIVVLSGTAHDLNDGSDSMLIVDLCSSIDDLLWEGNPGVGGGWIWQGPMSEGTHVVTATVTDSADRSSYEDLEVTVHGANHEPTCAILGPEEGARFSTGELVPLVGEAADEDDDELLMLWTSDLQGSIFVGESFTLILSNGEHVITLDVDDGRGGHCQDSVTITVGPVTD